MSESSNRIALPRQFYDRETPEVASELVGRLLVYNSPQGRMSGIIVETEAYGLDDPASHAYRGKTDRNAVMFGPAGFAYVYFTYGMHWCLNASTGPEGVGEAVLIRALEPVDGIDLMRANRGTNDIKLLCSGPARLCQAFGIRRPQNGLDLTGDILFITGEQPQDIQIAHSPRIGIRVATERTWRYHIAGSPFVSR